MASDRTRAPELRRAPGAPGSSGVTQDVVVLNDFGDLTLEQRTRTTKAGKTSVRLSLSIEAEPVLCIFDGVYLGAGPAQALGSLLQTQIRAISATVSNATILKRKHAATALAAGKAWAVERYKAARTNAGAPGSVPGDKFGNDSGMLANGVFVMQNPVEQSFTINVPANRLNPDTFGGGVAALGAFVDKLRTLVPVLGNPAQALDADPGFVRAVAESPPVVAAGSARFAEWRNRIKIAGATWRGVKALINVVL